MPLSTTVSITQKACPSKGEFLPKFKGNAYAKINLFLHIGEQQASGLHEIFALNIFVSLSDTLFYQPRYCEQGSRSLLSITGLSSQVVTKEQSSMAKVFAVFTQENDLNLLGDAHHKQHSSHSPYNHSSYNHSPYSGRIHINKRIPSMAGLGGGSSDAALTLRLLARCYEKTHTPALIKKSAESIGSDLYTCMPQHTNFVLGHGENITTVAAGSSRHLLAKTAVLILTPKAPKSRLSTAKMYQRFAQKHAKRKRCISRHFRHSHLNTLSRIGKNRPHFFTILAKQHRNDFTSIAIDYVPALAIALHLLQTAPHHKPLLARMSGSGSSCFAIFPDYAHAKKAQHQIMRSTYIKNLFSLHVARVIC